MDQAHVRALAAIQPFIYEATTAKSPSARYLSDLISRATSAPGAYVFTELLQLPVIQTLKTADTPESAQAHLQLLEIFSWGTYEEYKNTKNLPILNDQQSHKLRQLTLLTLASPLGPSVSQQSNQLTYSSLLSSLSLDSIQSLESLLTTSIYSGLLTARLSPTSKPPVAHITSVAPLRDLRPQSLPALLQILQTWEQRCSNVISDLEGQITGIRNEASHRHKQQKKRQDIVDAAVSEGADGKGSGAGAGRLRPRQPKKRDLDEQMDGEEGEELSSDDFRMDMDEGLDVSDGRGGGAAGSSRGAKRNRGRG